MTYLANHDALRDILDRLPSHIPRADEPTDAMTQAERRRIQNRVNQRTHRKLTLL
jgi:hypothetical protein